MVKTLARLHGLGRRQGEPRAYRCTSRAPHPHIAKPLESQFTEIPTRRAGRRRHVCEPRWVSSSLAHLAPAEGHDNLSVKLGDRCRVAHIALYRVNTGKHLPHSIKPRLVSARHNDRIAEGHEPCGKLEANARGPACYEDRIARSFHGGHTGSLPGGGQSRAPYRTSTRSPRKSERSWRRADYRASSSAKVLAKAVRIGGK